MTLPTIPDYELVRPIGRGGYGEVWLARGLTGAWRAVKVVWRNRFSDTDPYEREFRGLKEMMALPLAEAGALALHHVGRDEGGEFFYYVMELADDAATGRTVDPERYVPLTLKQLRSQRGRLRAREAIELGLVLARGLAALHARGLVHRDIKPSNVVLVNGAPKLADIGLVAASSSAHTFVGTEGFVPPEGPGSPAADVFALGRVLYELATGHDRQDFPMLPERFEDAQERAAFFRLNEVLLRACAIASDERYRDGAALQAALEEAQAGEGGRRRLVRGLAQCVGFAAIAVALIGGAIGYYLWRNEDLRPGATVHAGIEPGANISRPQDAVETAAVAASEAPKSLVVLPLDNLSPDPADADFADGMHAEIVAALSRNGELRVLSRSTGQALTKAGASRSALVSRLNIAHALSGTVWRHGSAVRISLELRRTTDNASIWQNRYERAFVDGFALQDEIAADVAKFLQARGSAGWYAGAKFMTRNVAAYQLFLRARDVTVRKGATRAAMAEQAELAEAALALDPEFMSAASLAASAYCYLYVNAPDGPAGRELAAKARHWAERAAQLVPGGAGEGALSVYYSLVERDSERAFVHAQNEVRALPNDANGHNRVATGLRAQGRLQEAVASYERALELDPLNARVLLNRVSLFGQLRRRPEFEAAVAACLELGGEHLNRAVIADFRFRLTGELPDNLENLDGQTFSGRLRMLWYGRRFEEMLQAAREEIAGMDKLVPARQIDALRAEVRAANALGREDEFSRAARRFGDEVRRRIDRGDFSAGYGEAIEAEAAQYAGEEERAVLLLRRLIGAAKPAQVNLRWGYEEALAGVYAWFGWGDECVALLERLVAVPSGITVPLLEREPKWDPVRNHPGFRALLAAPKNAEPL